MKTICKIVICAMLAAGISVVLLYVCFFFCHAELSWYEIALTGVVSALAANKLYKLSTKGGSDT